VDFIDLKTQALRIEKPLMARFSDILHRSAFILGPEITELEKLLAEFVGVKHAITVSSGADALLIALMALDIKPGDEVITPAFSFFATAEVVALLGAVPIFVDIDDTYNLDVEQLEAAITPRTRVIMPVSMYGQCSNFTKINEIARKHNLPVVEDGAQSFGASHDNKRSCGMTTIGCTSFFPSKPLGCYGDGGACFTNDDDLAAKMQMIRVHGQSQRYVHTMLGLTARFDTLQAAVLLEKLPLFSEELALRQTVADNYATVLKDLLEPPRILAENVSVYAQYTIVVKNRDKVQQNLKDLGIPTAVHYPKGLHDQPILKTMYAKYYKSFPKTEHLADHVLSLPMHPYLTFEQQQKIADSLKKAL
jgi:UDP-2-acetamido-2-deoxy-ribo-hexuluronate aminotransferase